MISKFFMATSKLDTFSNIFRLTMTPEIFLVSRNNEKIGGAHSSTEIRKATIRLLRTIILLTQTLDSLPDDIMMTMKLLYYDEGTLLKILHRNV